MQGTTASLTEKLMRERRARLGAERLLDDTRRALQNTRTELARAIIANRQSIQPDAIAAMEHVILDRRRLRDAWDALPVGLALLDHSRIVVWGNQTFQNILDGVPGSGIDDLMTRACENGTELREGTLRLTSGQIWQIDDYPVKGRHTIRLMTDITDAAEHARQLQSARSEADAANRAKTAFLANMSHELRTPMNGIIGMADLLVETPLTPEQRVYAETISASGEALLTIINEVLDYSKIEANKMAIYAAPFDLMDCITQITLLLYPLARNKGLQLVVDYSPRIPTQFIGDLNRIRQILTNLIGNALKFTETGYVTIIISGIVRETECDLTIYVHDTGIGIAPADQQRIYDEFDQVENAHNRRYDGTGLGLAISRRLVGLMGGRIDLVSALNEGSCFMVSLQLKMTQPAAQPEPFNGEAVVVSSSVLARTVWMQQAEMAGYSARATVMADENLRDLAPAFVITDQDIDPTGLNIVKIGGMSPTDTRIRHIPAPLTSRLLAPRVQEKRLMRILTAEDNRTNRLVFEKMVQGLNIDLCLAVDGFEAVREWQDFDPDLIFMDISMPGMDGLEAIAAIRQAEETTGRHVPICALTAHAMASDHERILSAGADYYLTKPIKRGEITECIRTCHPQIAEPLSPPETS